MVVLRVHGMWLKLRFITGESACWHMDRVCCCRSQVYNSAREVNRRARMSREGKREEKRRFDKFMKKAEAERAVFEKHRNAALLVRGGIVW